MRAAGLLAAALAWLPAGMARADQLDAIRDAGVLRVAVLEDLPPFGFHPGPGQALDGYDVAFAQGIARHLGVALQLVPVTVGGRIDAVRTGAADIVVADETVTEERQAVAEFSNAYLVLGAQFLVPARAPDALDRYARARLGVVAGTTEVAYLVAELPLATTVTYPSMAAAMQALKAGAIDAVVHDGLALAAARAAQPAPGSLKLLPTLVTRDYVAVALAKGEPALRAAIDAALAQMERSGAAAALYRKWFGALGGEREFTIRTH